MTSPAQDLNKQYNFLDTRNFVRINMKNKHHVNRANEEKIFFDNNQ